MCLGNVGYPKGVMIGLLCQVIDDERIYGGCSMLLELWAASHGSLKDLRGYKFRESLIRYATVRRLHFSVVDFKQLHDFSVMCALRTH